MTTQEQVAELVFRMLAILIGKVVGVFLLALPLMLLWNSLPTPCELAYGDAIRGVVLIAVLAQAWKL